MCDQHCAPPVSAANVPAEARRRFMKSAARLPLAAVLATPHLSRAADARTESVTLDTAAGKISAALALPDAQNAPAVLLIHEWWGLNAQIKAVAAEFASLGFVALAVDLYGREAVTDAAAARALMQKVEADIARATLTRWAEWLQTHPSANGKVGVIGWCFGGGWALRAAVAAPLHACVVYYGNVQVNAKQLRKLTAPVLGHFATRDAHINREMVGAFSRAMQDAGKPLQTHWYEAGHAFANPSGARYDEADAQLAWRRTVEFFRAHLR